MPEIAATPRLSSVLDYLDYTGHELLTELHLSQAILNDAIPGKWTVAQIAQHLIRAERIMLVIWKAFRPLDVSHGY